MSVTGHTPPDPYTVRRRWMRGSAAAAATVAVAGLAGTGLVVAGIVHDRGTSATGTSTSDDSGTSSSDDSGNSQQPGISVPDNTQSGATSGGSHGS